MRTYKQRFLRRQFSDMVDTRVESRDAILWDVIPNQRVCRVKIQGSDNLIIARYPENWRQIPEWLKPGNAVRIAHRGGVRGHIEVVGHGMTLPTAVTGGTAAPAIATPADAVMSGCMVQAFDPAKMGVIVRSGTFRIGGIIYTLEGALMSAASPWLMGVTNLMMGQVGGIFVVPTAPAAGKYRIDIIAVGTDLVIDYIAGSATAIPVQPDTPADHVLFGTILVSSGVTSIPQTCINRPLVPPAPATLGVTIADNELAWAELSTTITVKVYDQYGQLVDIGSGFMTAEFLSGNGTLSVDGSSSKTIVGTRMTGSQAVFTYTRDKLATDVSPILKFTLEKTPPLTGTGNITLLDSDGNEMWGT